MNALLWFIVGAVLGPALVIAILWSTTSKSERPPTVPKEKAVSLPWGAIDLEEQRSRIEPLFETAIESVLKGRERGPRSEGATIPTYSFLALSGGGSNGAFGAGILCGWTAAGTRPVFRVVTGVSAGSLQATFAFLGSEYDDQLKEICTAHETSAIWTKRSPAAAVFQESLYDTAPLKGLIDHYVTDDLLAAVAAKHGAGYRLYVGTTNMDTSEFVVWDMGKIASSGRPDAKELYREILLASCSVPVLYPPVYLPIEHDGRTYQEMHADGGVQRQVFFHGCLVDLQALLEDARAGPIWAELYIIRNGKLKDPFARHVLAPRTTAIASRTIETLFEVTLQSQLYRLYVQMTRAGADFNVTAIPPTFPDHGPTQFDLATMHELFDVGYRLAAEGHDWLKEPPGLDPGDKALQVTTNSDPEGIRDGQ